MYSVNTRFEKESLKSIKHFSPDPLEFSFNFYPKLFADSIVQAWAPIDHHSHEHQPENTASIAVLPVNSML